MRLVFWAGFWVFLADQASKYLVVHWMNLREVGSIDVMPPLLNLRMAWNYGINFGLFSGDSDSTRWILIGIAIMIVAFVLYWLRKEEFGKIGLISAGILIGGALGNIIDRILYGAVADFLNMSCCGFSNPFSFNVADIAIFAGALGMVIFAGDSKEDPKTEI
ncbi:signal peptidase II [Planktotalea frisia]|jgi:signal peptidase II|uniref:Lipoprotein signal peptidase n=1 Tax=Planktotalea frisia TaxID=696762 RepID=A0A1L9P023_9RHOB|nr:signal peptidase II [Planktotalea frisia]OJI94879.1 lipoprotein signal peptidase [Planktotalea frisia]PZX31364.1 signal peptidase II [Planktotalea frisia]